MRLVERMARRIAQDDGRSYVNDQHLYDSKAERWIAWWDEEHRQPPDSDFCSRCREHTGFEQDELSEWLSVCCSAPAAEIGD